MPQVNFELRRLVDKKGPDEEEFTKLANSVDHEFTNCLLEPLKSNTEARHAFGDSLDDIIEAGIELEQKKVAFLLFLSYLFCKIFGSTLQLVGKYSHRGLVIACVASLFVGFRTFKKFFGRAKIGGGHFWLHFVDVPLWS